MGASPQVCIVLPVRNGTSYLRPAITGLHSALPRLVGCSAPILVAENGSTDGTQELAASLAREFPSIQTLHLPAAGRGAALRSAWQSADADVLAYMDVDLATDLAHLPELVLPLLSGKADVAFGSRLVCPRSTQRNWRREALSRGYNALVRRSLSVTFMDAQCGFKAISRRVADTILPLVQDQHWFFDTELLTLAEFAGCRLHEFPVHWQNRPQSTVKVLPTIAHMVRGVSRLRRSLRAGAGEEARRRWLRTPQAATVRESKLALAGR